MKDRYSVVFDYRFTTPASQQSDHEALISKAVGLYDSFFPVKANLLMSWQSLGSFNLSIKEYKAPDKMPPLFVYNSMDERTTEIMIAVFDIHFSPPGSSS